MPICPRCGKALSTDQALSYHLNRKYKCNSWTCKFCERKFDTRFSLNIHQNQCELIRPLHSNEMFHKLPIIYYIIDANDTIRFVSNQAQNIYGQNINDILHTKINKNLKTHKIQDTEMNRFVFDEVIIDIPV